MCESSVCQSLLNHCTEPVGSQDEVLTEVQSVMIIYRLYDNSGHKRINVIEKKDID